MVPLVGYRGQAVRPRSRGKHKGRKEGGGSFAGIPHAVMDSAAWIACSKVAIALLMELARQYNGRNNGDLCAALSLLRKRGWKSSDTISTALKELRHYGLIVLTRQGGLLMRDGGGHTASLYALTWQPIDPCEGKLDHPPTATAPGQWRNPVTRFERPAKKRMPASPRGSPRTASRIDEQKKAA